MHVWKDMILPLIWKRQQGIDQCHFFPVWGHVMWVWHLFVWLSLWFAISVAIEGKHVSVLAEQKCSWFLCTLTSLLREYQNTSVRYTSRHLALIFNISAHWYCSVWSDRPCSCSRKFQKDYSDRGKTLQFLLLIFSQGTSFSLLWFASIIKRIRPGSCHKSTARHESLPDMSWNYFNT